MKRELVAALAEIGLFSAYRPVLPSRMMESPCH